MQFHVLVQAVTCFGIVDTVHRYRFRLRQQLKCKEVDRNSRAQDAITFTARKRKKVQARPVEQRAALHIVIINDLYFYIDQFARIKLAGNVQTRQFSAIGVRRHLRLPKRNLTDLMLQRFLQHGIQKINGDLLAFLFAEDKFESNIVHRIEALLLECLENLCFL